MAQPWSGAGRRGGRKDDCGAAVRCTPRGVRPGALRAEAREGSQKIPAGRSPRRCTQSPAAGTADTPGEHVSLRVELRLDSRQDALPYPVRFSVWVTPETSRGDSFEGDGDWGAEEEALARAQDEGLPVVPEVGGELEKILVSGEIEERLGRIRTVEGFLPENLSEVSRKLRFLTWKAEAADAGQIPRPGVSELVFDAYVIVAIKDIASFVKVAQSVVQVVETRLKERIEVFGQGEGACSESGIDSRHKEVELVQLLRECGSHNSSSSAARRSSHCWPRAKTSS